MMSERITSLDQIEDPEKFLAAYYKAMDEAKGMREENKTLRAQVESTDEEAISQWRNRALRAEAKTQLEAQGVKNPDRILKYVSLDGLGFDEDENITGLDDRLTELKGDFPELFDAKVRAGRKSVDIHAAGSPNVKKDTTDMQLDSLFS